MTENNFNLSQKQRWRRHFLYGLALLVVVLRFFSETQYFDITYTIFGVILVLVMALGRAYCMNYIAERKSSTLVTWGPYSICRNPLYLFSVIGAVGVGLLLQSIIFAIIGGVGVYAIFFWVILNEEKNLTDIFGDEYRAYCQQTIFRILPNPTNYVSGETVSGGNTRYLINRTFFQAILLLLVFIINPLVAFAQQYYQPLLYLP